MLLDINLQKALEIIKDAEIIRDDNVIPAQCPPAKNNLYSVDYEWMFGYERELSRFLDPWLKKYREKLFGDSGVISEAISNAYVHGNKRNPRLSINIKVYKGECGLLVSIKDSGKGFDIEMLIYRYNKGKTYFNLAGNGTRLMFESNYFGIFYTNRGNTFNLLYIFDCAIENLHSYNILKE